MKFCVVLVLVVSVIAQEQNDPCQLATGEQGFCTIIQDCPSAIESLKENVHPVLCGFSGINPVICCPKSEPIKESPVGEKANAKCMEYSPPPLEYPVHAAVAGVRALAKEFPHMAALGYQHNNQIGWYCGGSLISERYVISAAHCLYHRDAGPVTYIRLGDLNIQNDTDDAQPQDYTIVERIPHPDYKPPQVYNDIALLRLDRDVTFTDYVKPLCLQTEYEVKDVLLPSATGWGRTEFGGETSDHLIKVDLNYFSNEECNEAFKGASKRRLPNGVVDRVQLCAGSRYSRMDTCQGDSGGPLQTYNTQRRSHKLIGITSFGIACGTPGIPAVYTRISNYVGWIESIVWPN